MNKIQNKKGLMGGLAITLIVIGVIVLIGAIIVVSSYNRFVYLDQNVEAKWSDVENHYQRQADLIPNLVSVVSSAVSVETTFVKDVVEARTQWNDAQDSLAKDQAGVTMTNSMTTFVNAVAENYPQLQANAQYVALTDELSGTQNRITVARSNYIQSVQSYNVAIKKFPGNILAGMFGFSNKEYYSADLKAMTTPILGSGNLPQ